MMLRIFGTVCAAAIMALLISSCAGSTTWAKHASSNDIQAATDFDLCHGYRNYTVNDAIKYEILKRKLMTMGEWNQLISTGHPPPLSIGSNKCLAFVEGFWSHESLEESEGQSVEKWEYPGCEPTLFTLLGKSCPYRLEVIFEDNVVKSISCHGKDCESLGYQNADDH